MVRDGQATNAFAVGDRRSRPHHLVDLAKSTPTLCVGHHHRFPLRITDTAFNSRTSIPLIRLSFSSACRYGANRVRLWSGSMVRIATSKNSTQPSSGRDETCLSFLSRHSCCRTVDIHRQRSTRTLAMSVMPESPIRSDSIRQACWRSSMIFGHASVRRCRFI